MNQSWTHEDQQIDVGSPHRRALAEAQLKLGVSLAAKGESAGAADALRAVDPDDDQVIAARACLRLHRLCLHLGEETEAWEALSRARELSDPRHSPDVELELAAHAAALGQFDDAVRRYSEVLALFSDSDRLGAVAAYRLAELRHEQGARNEAVTLWRGALQGADENLLPHVLMRLADQLRTWRQLSEAEELYRRVIATDHPDLAPRAALAAAGLLEQQGAFPSAIEFYTAAVVSADPDVAEVADQRRRLLLQRRARGVAGDVTRSNQGPAGLTRAKRDLLGRRHIRRHR